MLTTGVAITDAGQWAAHGAAAPTGGWSAPKAIGPAADHSSAAVYDGPGEAATYRG